MDDLAAKSERRIPALAVSRGVGIGPVVFYDEAENRVPQMAISSAEVEIELEKLHESVKTGIEQLKRFIADAAPTPDDQLGSILNLQLLILEQSSFVSNIENRIRYDKVNAGWAVKTISDEYAQKQAAVADPHFQEKRLDIEDVCARLLAGLGESGSPQYSLYNGAIVVARELRPSAIIDLVKNQPAGIITQRGGWTSHTSILAREFKLPMVSGIKNYNEFFSRTDQLIVDGESGIVIVNPSAQTVDRFRQMQRSSAEASSHIDAGSRSETLDGERITIRANVDIPATYHLARRFGAEGIGLFRSESLISVPGSIPSEDEQFVAYKELAEVAGEAGVRIRTFDVGLNRLLGKGGFGEINPSLGLRSIRLSLHEQEFFRSQIRAILRASVNGRIDILLPMISGVSEVIYATAIINEEREALEQQAILIGRPKIGAMIEIPSGVFVANEIARRVDFLALGTNDLVQYLLAVDRDNDAVSDWYQTLHPAVIRAVKQVLIAAEEAEIPMLVCGEMAGSAFYVPLLIGLGARELSMNVYSISNIRKLISGITLAKSQDLVATIASSETSDEAEANLRLFYAEHWRDLFPPGLLNAKYR